MHLLKENTFKMKIATWNMANWSHKSHFDEAWDFYVNKIGCDILLFQEALPHPEILDINRTVYDQIGGTRLWGFQCKYSD